MLPEIAATWVQNYDPLGSALWSPIVAAAPIAVLSGLLLSGVSAPRAAMAGLATALSVAIGVFHMPLSAALAAAGYGGCFGLLPIGWIVLAAVFLYNLTVRTGQFEIVKHSVAALSPDRRIQVLLIAFCLGTFLEGAAGFGAPVAITSALLIGLGFSPLYAAGLALLANTAPVAFGSLGIPLITLGQVSGMDVMPLSQMAGRQLPLFALVIPAWLVAVMSGWKGVKGCWPALVVCGGSFAVIQFCTSNFHGPALVDVLGGIGSLVALAVLLRFWQPKEIWRFPEEEAQCIRHRAPTRSVGRCADGNGTRSVPDTLTPDGTRSVPDPLTPTRRQVAYAWTPWVLLSVMIFLWGWPAWKATLDQGWLLALRTCAETATVAVPGLDQVVYRTRPAVDVPPYAEHAAHPEEARFNYNCLSAGGTGIFLAALLAACWLRISPQVFWTEFGRTLASMRRALLTIACMLALAFVVKYSGADVTLGLAFVRTGWWYPFFAPWLGWLGVVVTGSDTSTNAMFGSLQKITAERLGLNPVLIVASNSTGGVMGKMIAAQSIVVAAAATKQTGSEGRILRFVLLHSLILVTLMGLLTLLQAYVLTWMVP